MISPVRFASSALALGIVLLAGASASANGARDTASIVTSISFGDAFSAMQEAGMTDLTDRTVDQRYPSIGFVQPEGFTIQSTLFACRVPAGGCSGAELSAIIPATTRANAEIIEGSIERSLFGFDASVTELKYESSAAASGQFAVMISAYLVYDHGVSDALFPETLRTLLGIVAQTKDFMLSDDPAHAQLWTQME